jgi:hypothetical protein
MCWWRFLAGGLPLTGEALRAMLHASWPAVTRVASVGAVAQAGPTCRALNPGRLRNVRASMRSSLVLGEFSSAIDTDVEAGAIRSGRVAAHVGWWS